ncbi:MAG: fatty acid desaturase [Candidatus Obscuribacterales bacterium]|nr:fatty acid desaturase [Candidatus Obscuribacterales bacterium]
MENLAHVGCDLQTFLVAFFASYVYAGLGITLGYHRLLTHKSLQVPKWLEYLVVAGGYLCLMGSPVIWVAVHRLHHLKSDQPGDPHSPRDGVKHALYGWMFEMEKYQTNEEVKRVCADLIKDPVYRRLGCTHTPDQAILCFGISLAVRAVMLVMFGWVVVLANVLATAIVFWSTQCVNAYCHLQSQGYRSFNTREDSRNVWWVAILTLGEGWHNNHHAMPKSARHGMAPHEIDVTWITVWLFEKLGLAKAVVRPNVTVAAAKRNRKDVPMHSAAGYVHKSRGATVASTDVEDYNESQLILVGSGSNSK